YAEGRQLVANRMNDTADTQRNCANCGAALTGRYCADCGQEDHALAVPLPRLILDFLSDVFQFDARIWRTLGLMLFRPGHLTREYLAGHRQRYIPPVRLYLFVSIAFFLTVGLLPAKFIQFKVPSYQFQPNAPAAATRTGAVGASTAKAGERVPSPGAATHIGDAVRAGFAQALQKQTPETATRTRAFQAWLTSHSLVVKANPAKFQREFWSNVPKVLFFLIPLFALLLKLLYLLRRRYYSEHLIFALHYHSVVFLNGLAIVLLSLGANLAPAIPGHILGWAAALLGLWTALYIFPALRTAYADTWPRAIGRGVALMLLYMVALLFGTVGAIGVTFAMA
ncbi:MAG: DUF3667 domain-containing protein, partial [Gammaproteobacteria bacterium]